jgi:hypothetical protein
MCDFLPAACFAFCGLRLHVAASYASSLYVRMQWPLVNPAGRSMLQRLLAQDVVCAEVFFAFPPSPCPLSPPATMSSSLHNLKECTMPMSCQ